MVDSKYHFMEKKNLTYAFSENFLKLHLYNYKRIMI